jgi:pyruvate formate lyase activating enzyme
LYQPEFTAEILRLCKENGIHTAIETSGFATQEVFCKVVQHCDLVLFDIKETDENKHLEYTGVPLSPILKNLNILNEMQIPFILRFPVIPGLNDRESHFLETKNLSETLQFCRETEIMPYHKLGQYKYEKLGRDYLCNHIVEPDKEQIQHWERLLK